MNFFSEERASELRDLFFESAQELLQALNEEGLELEKRPSDTEIIRTIRRTVHTLKGDSAACGFRELSELAHALEDVLTPEIAARSDASVAQVVLSAADMFDAMLSAYRERLQLPDGAPLRQLIRGIAQQPAGEVSRIFEPRFAWSEYEQLMIAQGAANRAVFNVGVEIDPACAMRSAGVQLVRNVLQQAGTVLVTHPEEGDPAQVESIEAAVASDQEQEWIARKCQIPAVVAKVIVRRYTLAAAEAVAAPASTEPEPAQLDPSVGIISEQAAPGAASPDISPAVSPTESAAENAHTAQAVAHTAPENLLRVDAERIDTVLNLVGELIIGRSMLSQTISEFTRHYPKDPLRLKFADVLAHQTQVLNELQRSVMKIRMVPLEQLFRRFPRVVRDVAKLRGKDVTLEISGQETDLDKTILDVLAEPMMHLVRNAVDHGIESPEERLAAGKPARGVVRLDAYHQGNQIVIEIADDGRGIDRQRVAAKALQRGLITNDELARMSEGEVLELIFESGFSTAEQVTELSGRGVGLDVVRTVLERIKGTVSVQTRAGQGVTFQLKVPLTLAIIKALLLRVGERLYAVPLSSVLEITRTSNSDIHQVDNHEVLQLRGQVLTLVRLSHLAETPLPRSRRPFVVVVAIADRRFGLIVDKLVGEEELVIKALDDQLVLTELISGASILGDGTVVLILNIAAVVEKLGRIRGVAVDAEELGTTEAMGAKA